MAKADAISRASEDDGGGWTFECPRCGFLSVGWGTKALAEARQKQHDDEHDGQGPMQELSTFRAEWEV